jgi:hypothetical protein
MTDKIKRYDPNDNAPGRQFAGMDECEFGDWVKDDDLILIKTELSHVVEGLEFRSADENKKLLRRIFNRI